MTFSSAISQKLIHFIVFSSKVFQRLCPSEMITNKKLYYGNILRVSPCDENRGKIDDLIAIYGPINCALYGDKIDQFDKFWRPLPIFFAVFRNEVMIYRYYQKNRRFIAINLPFLSKSRLIVNILQNPD